MRNLTDDDVTCLGEHCETESLCRLVTCCRRFYDILRPLLVKRCLTTLHIYLFDAPHYGVAKDEKLRLSTVGTVSSCIGVDTLLRETHLHHIIQANTKEVFFYYDNTRSALELLLKCSPICSGAAHTLKPAMGFDEPIIGLGSPQGDLKVVQEFADRSPCRILCMGPVAVADDLMWDFEGLDVVRYLGERDDAEVKVGSFVRTLVLEIQDWKGTVVTNFFSREMTRWRARMMDRL